MLRTHSAVEFRLAALILAAIGAVHILTATQFHAIAWDDSAITLGFARTFALSGKISPTLLSDRVEGYSTPLWMAVNALAYLALRDPDALLTFAQSASLALNLANAAMVFLLARRSCAPAAAALVALLFATQSITLYETINGMEHPLLAFLMLASFWGYRARERRARALVFLIASTLAVTVRWEAIWFLAPFFLRNLVEDRRRVFAVEHLLWAAAFAALTAFRFAYFGDLLPNTIIAKANPPYALEGWAVLARARAVATALLPLLPGAIVLATLASAQRKSEHLNAPVSSPWLRTRNGFCTAGIIAAGVVFVLAIGENWGPRGRLFFPALPFAFLALAAALGDALSGAQPRVRLAAQAGLLAIGLVTPAVAFRDFGTPSAPTYMPGVTVANIGALAPALERLREASGSETLTVAGPDMGGLLLYSDRLRVVDIGLLCSRALARSGSAGIRAVVFEQENADVIAVQGLWTHAVAPIDLFYERYVPVFVDGFRFFVRRDRTQALRDKREYAFASDGGSRHYDQGSVFFAHQSADDFAVNRRFGRYLVLTDRAGASP